MMIGVISGAAATLVLGTVWRLLTAEADGQARRVPRKIVERAARRLPPHARERYREEWIAEISESSDRPLSAMAQALGISRGASALALELEAVLVAAAPEVDVSAARGRIRLRHPRGILSRLRAAGGKLRAVMTHVVEQLFNKRTTITDHAGRPFAVLTVPRAALQIATHAMSQLIRSLVATWTALSALGRAVIQLLDEFDRLALEPLFTRSGLRALSRLSALGIALLVTGLVGAIASSVTRFLGI
jgi:hypothetical protein